MGFFSWLTADTGRSICNASSRYRIFTVYMHGVLPGGKQVTYKEESYQGVGDFGGKDYFVLLAEMNPPWEEKDGWERMVPPGETKEEYLSRSRGIFIAHNPIQYPQFTESARFPYLSSFDKQCFECPSQGYFYDSDEEDEPYFSLLGAEKSEEMEAIHAENSEKATGERKQSQDEYKYKWD